MSYSNSFCTPCLLVLAEFANEWDVSEESRQILISRLCSMCCNLYLSLPLSRLTQPSAFELALQFATACRNRNYPRLSRSLPLMANFGQSPKYCLPKNFVDQREEAFLLESFESKNNSCFYEPEEIKCDQLEKILTPIPKNDFQCPLNEFINLFNFSDEDENYFSKEHQGTKKKLKKPSDLVSPKIEERECRIRIKLNTPTRKRVDSLKNRPFQRERVDSAADVGNDIGLSADAFDEAASIIAEIIRSGDVPESFNFQNDVFSFQSIYHALTNSSIPWCRICGTTVSQEWFSCELGQNTLCSIHKTVNVAKECPSFTKIAEYCRSCTESDPYCPETQNRIFCSEPCNEKTVRNDRKIYRRKIA